MSKNFESLGTWRVSIILGAMARVKCQDAQTLCTWKVLRELRVAESIWASSTIETECVVTIGELPRRKDRCAESVWGRQQIRRSVGSIFWALGPPSGIDGALGCLPAQPSRSVPHRATDGERRQHDRLWRAWSRVPMSTAKRRSIKSVKTAESVQSIEGIKAISVATTSRRE